jgi:hypothetical protein
VLHVYEIEGHGTYWEIWRDIPGEPWQDEYLLMLEDNEIDAYIDNLKAEGMDFVVHTLEEYHVGN